MVFDVSTNLIINGKKYVLCLRNRNAFMAERELRNKNLLKALEEQPISMEDLFVLFKYSVLGGKQILDDDKMFELFVDAIGEQGYMNVFSVILETVMKSGLLGDTKKIQATE